MIADPLWMKGYRAVSLGLAAVFAAVGLLFLFGPETVIRFFNTLSAPGAWPTATIMPVNFFNILAAGYMYVVTVLAYLIYRRPEQVYLPSLLSHAKLFSAVASFAFFIWHRHYLIYLANGLVDGMLGAAYAYACLRLRRKTS